MKFESQQDVQQYLNRIPSFRDSGPEGADFGLESIRRFCHYLDNPQERIPLLHVAGTNGKGTTCRYLSSVYQQSGYRCGLFVSPHLRDFRERFTINGRWIGEEALIRFFDRYHAEIEECELSYFEICTALAFWWFDRDQVDLAVIETGLGGRLDATNVIERPMVSVITNIGKDHQELLGETIEEIAAEKAGIIKNGCPVVIGNVKASARRVIRSFARRKNAVVREADSLNPEFYAGKFELELPEKIRLTSGFAAPVNAYNIAACWQVASLLSDRFAVESESFRKGIATASSRYPHTGVFEQLHPDFHWYFDGAHNLEAFQALKTSLQQIKPLSEWIAVFCLMRDKIRPEILNTFSDFKKKYYYSLETNRAATFEEVDKQVSSLLPFPADKDSAESTLLNQFQSEFVIFTGSLYFYNQVRDLTKAVSSD